MGIEQQLSEENERLEKENKGLKAICSIITTSLKADCRYNTQLLERLVAMQETSFGGFDQTLQWRKDSRFKVLDSDGEHDPVYVITPNGEMFAFNHYNDHTTDLARAQFVAQTLNEAWDKIRGAKERPPEVCGCPYNGCTCCPADIKAT